MALIFSASADSGSAQRSSRILEPFFRWLVPNISPQALDYLVVGVRKCAHVAEYAVLALLVWRALRRPARHDPRPWSWPLAGWTLLLVAVYAATDEFHQLFVAGRGGAVRDVLLDIVGGILALLLLRAVGFRRKIAPIRPHG